MWLSDLQKLGAALVFGGVACFLLGIVSFFDARLLSFGNILFIAGVVLVCGFARASTYLTARRKRKGAVCFIVGILMVLRKWAFTGFMIELFGILNLFADFSGVILSFLRQLPIIGPILNHPSVAVYADRFASGTLLPI